MNHFRRPLLSLVILAIAAPACAVDAPDEATGTTREALGGSVAIQPDPNYGNGGFAFSNFVATPYAAAPLTMLTPAPIDLGTVVVGTTQDNDGTDAFFVRRFTPAGANDNSFGNSGNGVFRIFSSTLAAVATAVVTDSNARIIVAGDIFVPVGTGSERCVEVVRLTSTGVLDRTFGFGGYEGVCGQTGWIGDGLGTSGATHAVTLLPSGSIAVVGEATVSGTAHSTMLVFAETGAPIAHGYGHAAMAGYAAATQANGQIVVAGRSCSAANCPGEQLALERFNSDATTDATYGSNGVALGPSGRAFALARTAGDEMTAVGFGLTHVPRNMNLVAEGMTARFLSTGAPDTSWGSGGVTYTGIGSGEPTVFSAAAPLSDGSLVVVAGSSMADGLYTGGLGLVHFLANGTEDTSALVASPVPYFMASGLAVHELGAVGHAELVGFGFIYTGAINNWTAGVYGFTLGG